jgi:hypothetical protein
VKRLAFAAALLAVSLVYAAGAKKTFTGTITDNMCAKDGHASMRMGPTDAECTVACVAIHGASYVLFDGKEAYILSDQKTPEKFAAQKVKVVGKLNPKTKILEVVSITSAK